MTRNIAHRKSRDLARDPEKSTDFSDKIMRKTK